MREEDPAARRGDPADPGTLSALAGLLEQLAVLDDLGSVAHAAVDFAVQHLDADEAGLALASSASPRRRLAASAEVLTDLDAAPGGPWSASTPVVLVDDVRTERRWPVWCAAAERHGLRTVCAVVVAELDGRSLTLDLYAGEAGRFADAESSGLVAVARILGAGVRDRHRTLHLRKAMDSRDLVAQAQGVLMERHGLTRDEAMEYLRRISQHTQRKVREIATGIVFGDETL